MSEKIRFAVIGSGHIGKRHATMIQQNGESKLVGMVDTNISLKSDIEQQFQVPFFASLEELIASGIDFDVANICTPNNCHAPQALAMIEAGKHVVVEKPMALNRADCEEIMYHSLQAGKLVF